MNADKSGAYILAEPADRIVVTQDVGAWRAILTWPVEAEQGGPRSIEIVPGPSASEENIAAGVSSTVLRRIDFQVAAKEWRQRRADKTRARHREVEQWGEYLRTLPVHEGITDRYLAWLSRAYVSFVVRGEQAVTARLAELAERRPETIRAHLKEARKRELLTTVKGRAGGKVTPKAKYLMESTDKQQGGDGGYRK